MQDIFLSAFSLGEWSVHNWVSGNTEGYSHGMTMSRNTINDERREKGLMDKLGKLREEELYSLGSLPKLPSYYCQQSSSKLYIEPGFGKSWVNVHKEYVKVCFHDGTNPVNPLSQCIFDRLVKENNLAFKPPKKDRCNKCIMYETGNSDEIKY